MAKLENIYNVKDMEMAIQAGCKSQVAEIKRLRDVLQNIKEAYPPKDLNPWKALNYCKDIASESLENE